MKFGLMVSEGPYTHQASDSAYQFAAAALAGAVLLLRPYWPLNFLPGWVVGALLLWASVELLGWIWWPRRWR